MFQLNVDNNRQHQTLAFNSLVMNNIFNLANCFNQFGAFNLRSGFRNQPFFLCVLLVAVALQVTLSELNAFGLESLNPTQWFVCAVFALMSALIAPLTGQQSARLGAAKSRQKRGIGMGASHGHNKSGGVPPKGMQLMHEAAAVQHSASGRHSHQSGRPSQAITPKHHHRPYDNHI